MNQMKTRSVGARARRSQPAHRKALIGLMLCSALALAACGQKRPLQLPPAADKAGRTAGTGTGTGAARTPAAQASPASAPASAAIMPQR